MARIRSIKPEFWSSPQLAECSPTSRLCFVGMWSHADDAGNLPADPRRLKMQVFPGDAFTPEDVQNLVDQLTINALVQEYENAGDRYWSITGWKKHQRIEKPTYRYPSPGHENSTVIDSETIRRRMAEYSATARVRSGVEWSGVEDQQQHNTQQQQLPAPANAGAVMGGGGEGPKPPTEKHADFHWLSWDFYLARVAVLQDHYFNPWDKKHFMQCRRVLTEKANGNYDEARRRAQNLCMWALVEPNFYNITPGDLLAKWERLNDPPRDGNNYGAIRGQAFAARRDAIVRELKGEA